MSVPIGVAYLNRLIIRASNIAVQDGMCPNIPVQDRLYSNIAPQVGPYPNTPVHDRLCPNIPVQEGYARI